MNNLDQFDSRGPIGINYEFRVPGITASYTRFERIRGSDREELNKRAEAFAKAIGAVDFIAVGLHNVKADWEAAFGEVEKDKYPCGFADSFPQAPIIQSAVFPRPGDKFGWWQRFLKFIGVRS
jgi:hypothetical protein